MSDNQNKPVTPRAESVPTSPTRSEVDTFLAELKKLNPSSSSSRGRLIFALDATASRQPTWDTACKLQADMFREAGTVGGLDMQLVFYRGLAECKSSRWFSNGQQLAKTMSQIVCDAGHTQIEKILVHARKESKLLRVNAMVFVGDGMEENSDTLAHEAGELGQLRVPVFMFQEGDDRNVERVFREIARLTRGAYCRFDPGAARQLGELPRAVAVYAAGGMTALAARRDAGAVKLLSQMK